MIALALLAPLALFSPAAKAEFRETVPVTYEIPAPASLKAFAQVSLPYQIQSDNAYATQVRYTLPATLLGHERTFTLSGKADPLEASYELSGPDASMTCTADHSLVTCRVTHNCIAIDLPAVKAALEATDLPPAQKEGRFQLASFAARLGGDLVGVFTYSRTNQPSN